MNEMATGLNAAIDRWVNRLLSDLDALPHDKRRVSLGGETRPPDAVAVECGYINGRIAALLAGDAVPPGKEFAEYEGMLADLPNAQAVAEYVQRETDALKAAVSGVDASDWFTVLQLPNRPPMTRFEMAALTFSHMAYHDGQLNVIHLLTGDTQMHWERFSQPNK